MTLAARLSRPLVTTFAAHHPIRHAMVAPDRDARVTPILIATLVVLTLGELALTLWTLGGNFSYTLDDPYIHLALADRIAEGHYGLNAGEMAAPSSSIAYPFLLAGLSFMGLGQFSPLLVSAAATLVTGVLLGAIVRDAIPTGRLASWALIGLLGGLVLAFNIVGLEFNGLEHALHVALTLAWLLGATRFLRSGTVEPWWCACAVAEPLVRYEGAALWLAAVGLLLLHRRLRLALAVLIAGAIPVVLFSLFLHANGLAWLPSSVLVKSRVLAAGAHRSWPVLMTGAWQHVVENVLTYGGVRVLAICLALVLMMALGLRSKDEDRTVRIQLAGAALLVSLAHLAFGRFGWFARYEIYLVVLDSMVLLIGFGRPIGAALATARPASLACVILLPPVFFLTHVQTTIQSFAASRNIYDQQFQMHRFLDQFYRQPVGVNDLGWVSYQSPTYVLDFWGLGSEDARRAPATDPSAEWMDVLARQHGVGLAMIYERWFDRLPAGWRPVARLSFSAPRITAADNVVTFYATNAAAIPAIDAAIAAFRPTLPPGTTLESLLEKSNRG